MPTLAKTVLSLALLAASAVCLAATPAAPYDLIVHVVWGDESVGPESLREQVERSVVRWLDAAACYHSLARFDDDHASPNDDVSDLLFTIEISNLEVREDWEVSIAERTSPDQQPGETDDDLVATVGFDVDFVLQLLPERQALRQRSFRHEKSYRPRFGEDARESVRDEAIDDLARSARSFVCNRRKKLAGEIARATAD
ncbi:MAG TPA: hypothetical protein VD788_10115 [Candidatus Polarisedimenticolaceae bacterium]|nr:hypothetical protein [Candidatus Polarisedimenticolaceae bacterium]